MVVQWPSSTMKVEMSSKPALLIQAPAQLAQGTNLGTQLGRALRFRGRTIFVQISSAHGTL